MRFMQTESVLQTKNRSGPAKNRFSVALHCTVLSCSSSYKQKEATLNDVMLFHDGLHSQT